MSVRRFAALTTVLAGGALAALPFYRPPKEAESAAAATMMSEQPQRSTIALTGGLQALPVPQIAVEAPQDLASKETSPASLASDPRSGEWHQPSPLILANDENLIPDLPRLPVVRRTSHDRSAATIHEPDFSGSGPPLVQTPVAQALPPRRHRIVDGDSLSKLALRYLGDERRANEIVAINHDVLRDPALLPVGKTIYIPRPAQQFEPLQ